MNNSKINVLFNLFVVSVPFIVAILSTNFLGPHYYNAAILNFILFNLFFVLISSGVGYTSTFFERINFRFVTLMTSALATFAVLAVAFSSDQFAGLGLFIPAYVWFFPLTIIILFRAYYQVLINSATPTHLKVTLFLCFVYILGVYTGSRIFWLLGSYVNYIPSLMSRVFYISHWIALSLIQIINFLAIFLIMYSIIRLCFRIFSRPNI